MTSRPSPSPNGRVAPPQLGGVLDRVRPVNTMPTAGLKVSLYGQPKTGKTRLIGTFPTPTLILGGEDGTQSIRSVPDVDFIRIIGNLAPVPLGDDGKEVSNYVRLRELGGLVESLRGSRYRTVAVDTASALADIVLANAMGVVAIPAQNSFGMTTRENYGQQGLEMKTILREVLNLGQHVVVTAHERNFNEESGSELMTPTVGSALSPSTAGWLNGAVDYVCQTFKRERVAHETKSVDDPKKKGQKKEVRISRRTGEAEYCLRVGPHPVYLTGFRLPPGYELPDVLLDPTFEKIQSVIRGEYDATEP